MTATGDAQQSGLASAIPPVVQLRQITSGFWLRWMLYVVAERGVADLLADGPRMSVELAQAAGLHEPSLYRILRTLASVGVFEEESPHRFALTPLGSALKTGDPSAARDELMCTPWIARAVAEFPRIAATGENGMQLAFGMPIFEYLTQNPQDSANFNRMMIASGAGQPAAVAEAYDFSGVRRLVDVGGGIGTLVATVLGRYPLVQGVLFDRPDVIEEARATLAEHGVAERCEVVGGDFFLSSLPSGDAYVMSHIIHDFYDDDCITILRNCRKAMAADGRLLLVEIVLPPGDTPHRGKMLDMMMLVLPGGMERTEGQYGELLHRGGFRLTRVIPTQSDASVIEAVPDLEAA